MNKREETKKRRERKEKKKNKKKQQTVRETLAHVVRRVRLSVDRAFMEEREKVPKTERSSPS
jgi:hypothetical protein